jgi:hypothetical protein
MNWLSTFSSVFSLFSRYAGPIMQAVETYGPQVAQVVQAVEGNLPALKQAAAPVVASLNKGTFAQDVTNIVNLGQQIAPQIGNISHLGDVVSGLESWLSPAADPNADPSLPAHDPAGTSRR